MVHIRNGFLAHLVEIRRELTAESRHQMAVAVESGGDRGVAEASLDLLRMGALLDEERRAGVSQVVEPEVGIDPGSLDGRLPNALPEVRTPDWGAVLSAEHELRLWRGLQMSGQEIDEEGRDVERPPAGAGLRFLDVSDAARDFLEGSDDADLTLQQIQVLALEPDELAPPGAR